MQRQAIARQARLLLASLAAVLRSPSTARANLCKLARVGRSGGTPALKDALLGIGDGLAPDAWDRHRARLQRAVVAPGTAGDAAIVPARVSILVPTFDTPAPMLRAMLDSVRAQHDPYWELCVADDGSRQGHVRSILQHYAGLDARIRLSFSATNRGVSHASNRALQMASAPFVVLLDHDDLLEPHALARVNDVVARHAADVVYSDEARVAPDGETVMRLIYRPAFSPELLRGHPYIVHLAGFRTQLLRDIGGFDESLAISQDYDLVLRATERARTVVHIPEVLYRWRIHGASAGHAKAEAVMAASIQVLQRHLGRTGQAGQVLAGDRFNCFQVQRPVAAAKLLAVIVADAEPARLRRCLADLETAAAASACGLVVVHAHASAAPDAALCAALRAAAPGDFSHVLLLDPQVEPLAPAWLGRMLGLAQAPGVGVVGPRLHAPDRRQLLHAGFVVPQDRPPAQQAQAAQAIAASVEDATAAPIPLLALDREVSALSSACLLLSRQLLEQVGGFDPGCTDADSAAIDLCRHVRAHGRRVICAASVGMVQHRPARGTVPGPDAGDADPSSDPFFHPGSALQRGRLQTVARILAPGDAAPRVTELGQAPGEQHSR